MRSSVSALTLVFTLLAISAFAQRGDNYIQLSHEITTETKDITGFDKIDVSEDFEVFIRFSDNEEKVVIESNENLQDLIQVEKKGKTLEIKTKSYSTSSGKGRNGGAKERLIAYITAKRLTGITGDADVIFELEDKLYSDQLAINLDDDCTLKGHLEVQNLVVELDGDSVIDIEGSATTMDAEGKDDSMINGSGFSVGDLAIKLSGDSEAKLTVNGDVDLRAKGDSNFYYRGNVNFVRQHLTGDSEVMTW